MKLHRRQEVQIALQASHANLLAQRNVARREEPGVLRQSALRAACPRSGSNRDCRAGRPRRRSDRHADRTGRFRPPSASRRGNSTQYLSRTGWTSRAKEKPRVGPYQGVVDTGALSPAIVSLDRRRRNVRVILVAPDATPRLARHHREPAAHQLHGLAFFVERLKRDRRLGRNAEEGRAIRLDGNGPQNLFHLPGPSAPTR